MKCKPKDASHYSCCMMPKPCEGDKCMARRQCLIEDMPEPSFSHRLMPPKALIQSGEGFCGMLNSANQGQVT